jgi:carboxymethylenebutenolidase
MDRKIIDHFGDVGHGLMDRRGLLKRLALLVGGAATAGVWMPMVGGNPARAEIVPKDDPRLDTEYLNYMGASRDIRAYSARPKGATKLPGVIVIHENRGLNAHIEDVTRRIALEGFLAFAPDALSSVGGTPEDEGKAQAMIGQLDEQTNLKNYLAAVQYLKTHPRTTGKVGVVGFCWGGGVANRLAVNSPDVSAVVPYYGRQPASGDVDKIKASLLLHYAGNDEGINKGIGAYEAALKKAAVDYRLFMYEGASHAFNNDTNADRYNREAAQLAWQRTIAFLKEKLKT